MSDMNGAGDRVPTMAETHSRRGRPTKLTSEVQQIICAAVRKGAHAEIAAGAAGVSRRVYFDWLERGEREDEGIYTDFLRAIRQAECECEVKAIEAWQDEGAGSWQARADFVGRRFRHRWAKQENVKLDATVKVTGARESLLAKLEQMAKGVEGDTVDPGLAAEADDFQGTTRRSLCRRRPVGDSIESSKR